MIDAFVNMFKIPELRKRLIYTLGMLAVYRVGIFITTPGVDRNVMRNIMATQSGFGAYLDALHELLPPP